MKELNINVCLQSLAYEELDSADRELVDAARNATRNAYAPFSRFRVGAAIRMENGEIVAGANQENAAFSSGTCAERAACFAAASRFPGVPMKKIAVAAWTLNGHHPGAPFTECFIRKPISPCGACRQALLEFEHLYGKIEVLLYGEDEIYRLPSIGSLLPISFTEF